MTDTVHLEEVFYSTVLKSCPLHLHQTCAELELRMSSVCGGSELSLGELPMESWMSRLPCALWDIPLFHLAIPGRMPCNSTLYGGEAGL